MDGYVCTAGVWRTVVVRAIQGEIKEELEKELRFKVVVLCMSVCCMRKKYLESNVGVHLRKGKEELEN